MEDETTYAYAIDIGITARINSNGKYILERDDGDNMSESVEISKDLFDAFVREFGE